MAAIFVCYPHDNHLLYLENCAREVIYEVSFGTVFLTVNGQSDHTGFQWPISPNLFKITTGLLLMMDIRSYMRFHLALLSLTLSDVKRSIQVTQVFNGLYLQIYSR